MAQLDKNLLLLAGAGAVAYFLLSKKQDKLVVPPESKPGAGSQPDGTTGPVPATGSSDTDEGTATPPAGTTQSGTGVFALGSDPFPALSMAQAITPRGPIWYVKHASSGRWGEASKDFTASEGYKNIGALDRNYHITRVQDTRGNAIWIPFQYNSLGYPAYTPLSAF